MYNKMVKCKNKSKNIVRFNLLASGCHSFSMKSGTSESRSFPIYNPQERHSFSHLLSSNRGRLVSVSYVFLFNSTIFYAPSLTVPPITFALSNFILFYVIKMRHRYLLLLLVISVVQLLDAAPVDPKKKDTKDGKKKEGETELDDLGLEYGRYLQQVVQALEEDKDFAKKLENISVEEIQSGKIADQLEFVKHNVRTKLDELKRIEVDRLRKLVQEQMERVELGLDRKNVKLPQHLDVDNVHTFEISDLKKLIHAATRDLEELDKKRREEFKKYEMEKELKYRESLKNMTEEEKKEIEKHHEELIQKHKDHPKVHHPGSKPQLEQVWEEEDHMPKEEFNPKTFFAMHDINGDGHLDEKEVEALLMPEIRKMYDPKNEEDDPAEMEEEYHRMREHIFNETDKNKDGLISLEEFIKMTQQQDFEQDEGWRGLDEQNVYSEAELEEYMRQRQMALQQQYYGGDPRMYYDVPHNAPNQGVPPHINYQVPHPGMQGNYPQYQQVHQGMQAQQQQYHQPAYYQQQDPAHQFQDHPQQQAQYHGVPPQNFQGVPNQQQQQQQQQQQFVPVGGVAHQQQQQFAPQGHVQQQYVPQGGNQQYHPPQGNMPPQQPQMGNNPQQQQMGNIPQQQQMGNIPQQPPQGNVHQQQFQGVPPPQGQQPQGSQIHQGLPPQQQQILDQKQQPPKEQVQKQAPAALNEVPNPPVQKVPSGQQQPKKV